MRDEKIINMQEMNARRSMLLLQQFEFMNTRQLATEQITSTRWGVFLMWWNPQRFKRLVDNRQKELLAKCKEELNKVLHKAQPIIQPVTANGVH